MQRFKNILLVLNPEVQETATLDKAVSLAKQNDARVILFSVVYKHPDLRRYPDSVGENLLAPLVAERRQWLQGFMPTLQEQGIDLLVMGTVCRTGIAGFLIGNTAEEVLNQVDCSVLTLKPEGFVTPVTFE